MAAKSVSSLISLFLLGTNAAVAQGEGQQPKQGQPCPHIIANITPRSAINVPQQSFPRVEIRHCDPVGAPMQVVAWKAGAMAPSVVLDVARFSFGPLLVDGNVFVMIFPGPYDSIVVLQYQNGEPKVVFTDSTHAEIWLATSKKGVVLTLDYGQGKKAVKTFQVDDNQLTASQ